MSITVLHKPKLIDFIGNKLKFKVRGENYIISDHVKARFAFRKVGDLTVGNTFHIPIPNNYNDYITISVDSTITGGNTILANATIYQTADELAHIVKIAKYYNVWVDNNLLYFEFKNAAGIDATFISFGGNAYEDFFDDNSLLEQNSLKKEVQSNYSISSYIHFNGQDIAVLSSEVDENGETEIEIGKVISDKLFNIGNIIHQFYSNTLSLRLKVGFSEHYDDQDWQYKFEELIALPGKISFADYPDFNIYSSFLTDRKKIYTHNHSFLKFAFFLNPQGSLFTVYLFANIFKTDGTNTIHTLHTFSSEEKENIHFFDLLIQELIQLEPELYRIDLYTSASNDTIKIYIEEENFMHKQFSFRNHFGVFEMITTTAFAQKSLNVNREINKSYVPSDYPSSSGEFNSTTYNAHEEISCETGYMSKSVAETMFDFIISDDFYELKNDKFIKCELFADDIKIIDEAENMSSIQFTYRPSYDA